MKQSLYILPILILFATSCTFSKKLSILSDKKLLTDSSLVGAHIGISIYEPGTKKYWYNYQDEKYFIPASTTKLFTLYAGMKYLSDSIIGINYLLENDTLYIKPTADPTLLHRNFSNQRVIDFLTSSNYPIVLIEPKQNFESYGKGWAWDDQNELYMPQRSAMPMYGNLFSVEWQPFNSSYQAKSTNTILPEYSLQLKTDNLVDDNIIVRIPKTNHFECALKNNQSNIKQEIPFETFGLETTFFILKKMWGDKIQLRKENQVFTKTSFKPLHSQSSDSVFKLMMFKSDNFFAEQTLLMASNIRFGTMNETSFIDTLLNNDFKDIPQAPRWVDGSGLSRYNLFTPKDFIYILEKISKDFSEERLRNILPNGGEGTLKNLFLDDVHSVYAKTGSLSNQFCLSGLVITKKKKHLLFSIMVNNNKGASVLMRKAIERYVHGIIKGF
jgi:D-alanyl-D-alanine carboxypeptidase/D-alanyl-D-alanine-endopeptidase (penicillin-binding protein 4)